MAGSICSLSLCGFLTIRGGVILNFRIGRVAKLVRYPVKSMAGTSAESAFLGWHGLLGDRRFAFRRVDDTSGFPWLTASRLSQLILYRPYGPDESDDEPCPSHVLTPQGDRLELLGEDLRCEISERFGNSVEVMRLKQGIFDDSAVSLISLATVAHVCAQAKVGTDSRRFRPNIVLECDDQKAFAEDDWVGSMLVIGEEASGPAVHLTKRDVRCMMINLDPETAKQDSAVLKATVRLNENNAGAYGTVVRVGPIKIGDPVTLVRGLATTQAL